MVTSYVVNSNIGGRKKLGVGSRSRRRSSDTAMMMMHHGCTTTTTTTSTRFEISQI